MRVKLWGVVALMCAVSICAKALAEDLQPIGSWMVQAKEDRFGEGGLFVAVTPADGYGFGVRCIEKNLTIAVANFREASLTVGDRFAVKLRVDQTPVVDMVGLAVAPGLIQFEPTTAEIVKAVRAGREVAVRIENEAGISKTLVFVTRENARALARLSKECGVDQVGQGVGSKPTL